jgi:hypothetical protein
MQVHDEIRQFGIRRSRNCTQTKSKVDMEDRFREPRRELTVGLEIFDGHKLGGTGVTLGNGFCKGMSVFSDRWLR